MAKRLGITFKESGAMVAFLASPEASYISGGVFAVYGGRLKAI